MNQPENNRPQNSPMTRRGVLTMLGTGAVATLAATPAFASAESLRRALPQDIGDADILTFALNLEYLEAEFYAMATTGYPLARLDSEGMGNMGATRGGKKVTFKNESLARLSREIARDELDHVRFLRAALGRNAIAKPEINLDALGIGFANESEFLILARAFEDVGVSAYRGAAKLIENKDYLDAAAGILATEAYHAGHLRSHVNYARIKAPKLDPKDMPPTEHDWVPTDKNGLAIGRTPGEVGAIVRGPNPSGGAFFPMGMNGKIR